ncbi:MAG: hypothetical protein U1E05_03320 [Patescibacteria group bacterium]|nr:hypothetical protein [Patescibacteria group bacterium]
MLSPLLVTLVLAANPAMPMPGVEVPHFAPASHETPASHEVAHPIATPAGWLWHRLAQNPRLLKPNRQYHQSHLYDPRLRLDYPWHKPRVRYTPPPMIQAASPGGWYEF